MSYKREKYGNHAPKEECDDGRFCPRCNEEVCACRKMVSRLEGAMCTECSDALDKELYEHAEKLGGGALSRAA